MLVFTAAHDKIDDSDSRRYKASLCAVWRISEPTLLKYVNECKRFTASGPGCIRSNHNYRV